MNNRLIWFIVAVAAQLSILAAVPAQKIFTRTTGKTVLLKVAPVDPYTIMSGYYVTLGYEISNPTGLPRWNEQSDGKPIWVLLKADSNGISKAISVHDQRPPVPADCVAIKGKISRYGIEYGIESYFIPEDAREKIAQDLRQHSREAKAEVKIDSSGNAALIKLIIQDRVYSY